MWTSEVAAINRLNLANRQLRDFLFGAERVALQPVTEGLRDMGIKNCFWCDRKLGSRVEVDHVIPWSHYLNDELSNLVLTDSRCNNDKHDRLVSAGLLHRWGERDVAVLRELAHDLRWPIDTLRTAHSARNSYRYLPNGVPVWAGRKTVLLYDEGRRHSAMTLLDQLSE